MTTPKKPAALVPSAASAWAEEPAKKEHELPTGRVMTLRRAPAMRRLIREGVVPSALLGIVVSPADANGDRTYTVDQKLFEEQRAAVVCAMVVEPPIVMDDMPGDEHVLYDTLADSEVDFIVSWAQEGLAGTARFLVDIDGDADGPSGEAVGEVSE